MSGWTLSEWNLSADGCAYGSGGHICLEAVDLFVAPTFDAIGDGITYTFEFDVTYSDDYALNIDDAAIRAQFAECSGAQFGGGSCENAGLMLLRTGVTTVPEPATFTLLGMGLAGLSLTRRRHKA